MVCPPQEGLIEVLVRDEIKQSPAGKKHCYLQISRTKSVESIFREVSKEFEYNVDEIELTFRRGASSVSTIFFIYLSARLMVKLSPILISAR